MIFRKHDRPADSAPNATPTPAHSPAPADQAPAPADQAPAPADQANASADQGAAPSSCFPAEPDHRSACAFCGRTCRVPVTPYMPVAVRAAYDRAGWRTMATCAPGAAHEHGMLGASYEEVIDERCGRRLRDRREHDRTRSVSQDLRDAARGLRTEVLQQRARTDQTIAKTRDVVAKARDDARRRNPDKE